MRPAGLDKPCGLAFADGHLYATDVGADTDYGVDVGCVVRSIAMRGGRLSTPAGNGSGVTQATASREALLSSGAQLIS